MQAGISRCWARNLTTGTRRENKGEFENARASLMLRRLLMRTVIGFGVLAFGYVLTAPPIVKTMTKRTGSWWWPAFYAPMMLGLENNVTHPVFKWYFNDVWDCDLVFL